VVSCLSALPELCTLRLLLTDETRQPGSFNGALWCQVLLRAALVPQLRTLLISGKARIPPYAEWAALLENRRAALVHAELHMWHRHPHVRRRTPPPPRRIEARLAALVEGGMTVRITTPGYTWPWDAEDVDHFDFGRCFVSLRQIPSWALELIISARHRSFWVAYNAHAVILAVLNLLCLSIPRRI
jgi:hypothetical protein